MIIKKTIYQCSNCKATFDDYGDAMTHDLLCDKCYMCDHGYYVYGCEFECEYKDKCGWPGYKYYKESENMNDK